MKIHSGEIVTKLYLRLQEVLKKVSSSSLSIHLLSLQRHGVPKGLCPVTAWVTPVGDVLWLPVSQELVYLPQYLNLLCGMTVMYHEELTAQSSLKANDAIKVR